MQQGSSFQDAFSVMKFHSSSMLRSFFSRAELLGRNQYSSSASMTPHQILIALFIHVLTPLAGIACFILVARRASREGASRLFQAELFFLFTVYGGWLLVVLTSLFWEWSGMASLGALFLLFIAPFVLLPIAFHLWKSRNASFVHMRAFQAAIGYYPLLFLSVGTVYLLQKQ